MVEEVASGDAPKMEFAGRKRGRELHGVKLTRVTGEDRAGVATGAGGASEIGGLMVSTASHRVFRSLRTVPSAPSVR